MPRLLTLLLFSLGICVAGGWTIRPAAAAFMYSFTIDGFTDGASLTVSFDGADADGDGVILGFYPPDCGCGTTEITSLSVSFTGNSLIGSFNGLSTDLTDTLASLWFDIDLGHGFDLTYVLDPNGGFFLPDGSATGDAFISLGGMIDGVYTEIFGARCGTGFANSFGQGSGLCAVLSREGDGDPLLDFAVDVPEPMSLALFGGSLGLLAVTRRRRSTAQIAA